MLSVYSKSQLDTTTRTARIRGRGCVRDLSSKSSEVSVIAFILSIISVVSSGPRMASMIAGSRVVDGATGGSVAVAFVGVLLLLDWLVAQFSRSFARLSICGYRRGWRRREIYQSDRQWIAAQ